MSSNENFVTSKAWRAAHNHDGETGNADLPDMCHEIEQWIKNVDPRKKASLGTSSVLIDGAAKIYKQKTEQLFKDITELDMNIITRNRRKSDADDEINNESSQPPLETTSTPELMMRQSERPSDMSNTPVEDNPRRKPSLEMPNSDHSFIPFSEDSSDDLISRKSSDLRSSETSNRDWEKVKTQDDPTKESTSTSKNRSSTDDKRESTNSCENLTVSSKSSKSINKSKKRSSTENNDTTQSSSKRRALNGQETELYRESGRLSSIGRRSRKSSTETSNKGNEDSVGTTPGRTSSGRSIILVSSKKVRDSQNKGKGKEKIAQSTDQHMGYQHIDQHIITIFHHRLGKTAGHSLATQIKDQETQTDLPLDISYLGEFELDKNLPYGMMLIYDNPGSKIPSKFVASSLSPSVRNLALATNISMAT